MYSWMTSVILKKIYCEEVSPKYSEQYNSYHTFCYALNCSDVLHIVNFLMLIQQPFEIVGIEAIIVVTVALLSTS